MAEKTDTYRSIAAPSRGTCRELGSKFLSFAYPVESQEDVRGIVASLKKEYFDATHHCYAYRLGPQGESWRANDDGEPSSSAGRPILGQILSAGLSDVLVVVVRYYGGTKLGIPGLIKAYRTATQDALANAVTIERTATETVTFEFDYLRMNDVMKYLKDRNLQPIDQQFDLNCRLSVRIPLSQTDSVISGIPAKKV